MTTPETETPAGTMRRAAADMRIVAPDASWIAATADWLDATAQEGWPWPDEAVKVARAYLGETAATTGETA